MLSKLILTVHSWPWNDIWQKDLISRSNLLAFFLEFSTLSLGLGMHRQINLSHKDSLPLLTFEISHIIASVSAFQFWWQMKGIIRQIYAFPLIPSWFSEGKFSLEARETGKQICVPSKLPSIQFEIYPPPPSNPSQIWISLFLFVSPFPFCSCATVCLFVSGRGNTWFRR